MLRAWRRFHGSGGLRGSLAATPRPDTPTHDPSPAWGAGVNLKAAAGHTLGGGAEVPPGYAPYGAAGPEYPPPQPPGQAAAGGAAGAADPFMTGAGEWSHSGYGPVTPTITLTFDIQHLEMRRPGAAASQLLGQMQGELRLGG
jgi:hypothetical protein